MISSSNTISYATKTGNYPVVRIPGPTVINTDFTIVAGETNASIITDILFRNVGTGIILLDVFIGVTSAVENNAVQVSIPANAGNNGSIALAQLSVLAPALFDLDLAGNRVLILEPGITIFIRNKTATTGDMYIRSKRRSF